MCLIFLGRIAPENISEHQVPSRQKDGKNHLCDSEIDVISSICLFIINVYLKVWFKAPNVTFVPNQDLQVLTLINYIKIDADILKLALSILMNTWYSNPKLLSLFLYKTLDKQIKVYMDTKLLLFKQNSNDG